MFSVPGQPPRRLTDHPGLDYDPVVSPDGRWLVFCSERRGSPDLYALDLKNGGGPRLLIDSDALEDQAAFSPDGKSLAFVSTFSGNADIYLLPFRPDKTVSMTHARNVTRHPRGDFRPAFSPDSRRLAFSSDRDSPINTSSAIGRIRDGDIYTTELKNGRVERLTDAPGWDGSPAWSSDGATIAFYSQRDTKSAARQQLTTVQAWGDPQAKIWLMSADGSNPRSLTSHETLALSPQFLPDGRIAYSRKTKEGIWQIVSTQADGSGPRVESDSSTNSYWRPVRGPSPGSIIVHASLTPGVPQGQRMSFDATFREGSPTMAGAPFLKKLPDRNIELYPLRKFTSILHPRKDLVLEHGRGGLFVSSIDGLQRRQVFQFGPGQSPSTGFHWSASGEWIAFTQGGASFKPETDADIWKVKADGSQPQNLTPKSPGNDSHPSFSGDGKLIVFRSGRTGTFDLYLMHADGTNVRRLTSDTANDLYPVFSPTANKIAFLSNRDTQSNVYEIYLMDLDQNGSPGRVRRLTRNDAQEGHMAFSYDGKWLIYASDEGGINDEEPLVQSVVWGGQSYGEMYAYRIEDGKVIRLTHNKWEEGIPSWERAVNSQSEVQTSLGAGLGARDSNGVGR
jgi:Tol biopolymer transport system component